MVLGIVLVLSPETLVENVDFGTSPTLIDFLIAIPVGMVAFTGIDTISNMAEEAATTARRFREAMRAVVVAVMAISPSSRGGALRDAGGERRRRPCLP